MNTLRTILLMTVLTVVLVAGRRRHRRPRRRPLRPGPGRGHEPRLLLVFRQDRHQDVPRPRGEQRHPLRGGGQELCQRGNLPMPKVYILPQPTPNAFATGRNPEHAAVAATEGILQILSREELMGVMAHEMSHVRHRDILIGSIAATIAGAIAYLAKWPSGPPSSAVSAAATGTTTTPGADPDDDRWRPSPPCWCRWPSPAPGSTRPTRGGAQLSRQSPLSGQRPAQAGGGQQPRRRCARSTRRPRTCSSSTPCAATGCASLFSPPTLRWRSASAAWRAWGSAESCPGLARVSPTIAERRRRVQGAGPDSLSSQTVPAHGRDQGPSWFSFDFTHIIEPLTTRSPAENSLRQSCSRVDEGAYADLALDAALRRASA